VTPVDRTAAGLGRADNRRNRKQNLGLLVSSPEQLNENYPRQCFSRTIHDLTGFQRDLLYVIAGLDEPHGLAVKAELEEYYESETNHGRLYPNLDTLVEKSLVNKGELDQRTNYDTVTDRDRREIAARHEWAQQNVNLEE